MYNIEKLGNILIEVKPAICKTSFIEYYLKHIKRKHMIICDYIEYYDKYNYEELYSTI